MGEVDKYKKSRQLYRLSAFLSIILGLDCGDVHGAFSFDPHLRGGCVTKGHLDIERYIEGVNLVALFNKMDAMERRFGPQYFEWALTVEREKQKYWITQIDDVKPVVDVMEFGDVGRPLAKGHTVIGTGERICDKVVCCWDDDDLPALRRFNQENEGYLLVFSSALTTRFSKIKLTYGYYSNAAVLLEYPVIDHGDSPIGHLGGPSALTGKFFGVIDDDPNVAPQWELLDLWPDNEDLIVYHKRVRVLADQRRDEIIVTEPE